MNDLETQVRSILSDLADGAPPSNGLVQTLHARRRRARHRRLAVATAAAIVAVLAAGAATAELRKPDATLEVTTPTETHSGLPPAPVHVGKLPSGFGQTRVTIFDTGRWTIWTTRQKPDAELDVSIRPTKPSVNPWPGVELKAEKMSVGGRPATLTATPVNQGDSLATLRFERKPGQWIDVSVLSRDTTNPFAAVSKAELRAVALGLTDRPTPVAELLRVGSVPDPLKICASHDGSGEQYDTSSVAFCDPRVKTLPVELNATLPGVPDNAGVQLYWQHINGEWWREQKNGTQRAPIKVDGREGEVAEAGTAAQRLWYGWIRLSNDVVVNVEMREPNLFTRSQFIEFLGSVTPGEALK